MNEKSSGIAGLYKITQAQLDADKKTAELIFSSVTSESITREELSELVSPEAITQLIFLCIDLTKTSRAVVNQLKSKQEAKESRAKAQGILESWLDGNFSKYKGHLNNCADDAVYELPKIGKSWSWIRKEITAYGKAKKQVE